MQIFWQKNFVNSKNYCTFAAERVFSIIVSFCIKSKHPLGSGAFHIVTYVGTSAPVPTDYLRLHTRAYTKNSLIRFKSIKKRE